MFVTRSTAPRLINLIVYEFILTFISFIWLPVVYLWIPIPYSWASLVTWMVKNSPSGNLGSIPGLGGSPGRGPGKPLQYSCLENPLDRGARWAIVHGVTKSTVAYSPWGYD